MNKKAATSIVALLLAVLLSLVGCSKQADPDAATETPVESGAAALSNTQEEPQFVDLGWQPYAQLDGDLSVVAYHCCEEHVEVEFANGNMNTYSYDSASAEHVEQMRTLAEAGDGLGAYIETNAKTSYEEYVAAVPCAACSGDGKVTCSRCGGKGATYCGACGADGVITCSSCGGAKGWPCTTCSGRGENHAGMTCVMCSGSGTYTCPLCNGTGSIKCHDCGGTPKTSCRTCGASGQVSCATCAGSGFTVQGR